MNIEEIKQNIVKLSGIHTAKDGEQTTTALADEIIEMEAEMNEYEAENLILDYCINQGYKINGFPKNQDSINEEDEEEEYEWEHYRLYMDKLALEKDDVAELMLFYLNTFWPDSYESKEVLLGLIKDQIENGLYDVKL